MPRFRYTAVDPTGKVVKGLVEAASQAVVVERVQSAGQLLLRAEPEAGSRSVGDFFKADLFGGRGLGRTEVAEFTRELSIMLGAGQDLDHALRFLVETARTERLRGIYGELREKVRGGKALATALADQPGFSKLYVGLVRAGEQSGTLSQTLEHLAELLDRQRALAVTVQSAMIYPALLTLAAVGSVVLLLVFVLPQFTPIFQEAGAKLPTMTKLVIDAGDVVRDQGVFMLAGAVLIALAGREAMRRPAQRTAIDRMLLRLPVIGPLAKEIEAARLSRTLGTLLGNGVSLLSALTITRDVLGNRIAIRALEHAQASAKEGAGLAGALGEGHAFPERTLHLLRLGEETGRLSDMALRAAAIHDEQVRVKVQRLVSLMTPIITIVMGLMVASIISSLLLAMLSLNDLAL